MTRRKQPKGLAKDDEIPKLDLEFLAQTLREMNDAVSRVLFRLSPGMTAGELSQLQGRFELVRSNALTASARHRNLTSLAIDPANAQDLDLEEKMATVLDSHGIDAVEEFAAMGKKLEADRVRMTFQNLKKRSKK